MKVFHRFVVTEFVKTCDDPVLVPLFFDEIFESWSMDGKSENTVAKSE